MAEITSDSMPTPPPKATPPNPILDKIMAEQVASAGRATTKTTVKKGEKTKNKREPKKDTAKKQTVSFAGLVPHLTSTPKLATIPKKSAADKRIDRLEDLMLKQNELLESLTQPPPMYGQDDEYEQDYGQNFDQGQDYPYDQFVTVDSDEEMDEALVDPLEEEPKPSTSTAGMPPQTEVLPEAVCNEKLESTTAPVEKSIQIPSGFAAKFAAVPTGEAIDQNLANSMSYMLTNKLSEKAVSDVIEKYDTPANCKELIVPKVNPPIWDSLKPHTRSNDLKLQKVQKALVAGMTASARKAELTETDQDALACLAVANFELNMVRRELIKPGLNGRFAQLCKPTVPVTQNLFGDDLTRHINDLTQVHKATDRLTSRQRFSPYHNQRRGSHSGRSFLGQRGFPRQQQQRNNQHQRRFSSLTARRGSGRGAAQRNQQ